MKHSNWGLKLVFGLLGGTYTVVGGALLALAITRADNMLKHSVLAGDNTAFGIVGLVFLPLGIAFLIVTLLLARADKRHARMREDLLTWGSRVKGEVVDVQIDYTVRINRCSPVIVKVRCVLPSGEVTMKSPRLWDASPAVGDAVEVLYDPMNEKRYVIEFQQK